MMVVAGVTDFRHTILTTRIEATPNWRCQVLRFKPFSSYCWLTSPAALKQHCKLASTCNFRGIPMAANFGLGTILSGCSSRSRPGCTNCILCGSTPVEEQVIGDRPNVLVHPQKLPLLRLVRA